MQAADNGGYLDKCLVHAGRACYGISFGSLLAGVQGRHKSFSRAAYVFPAQHRHPFSVGISERIEGPSDDHD